MTNPPVVEARNISKTYVTAGIANRSRRVVPALAGVSLSIRKEHVVGILGESGSGKSTLARCLAGLETPDSGTVISCHGVFPGMKPSELRRHRRSTQFVRQNAFTAFSPRLSLEEIVSEPMAIEGCRRRERLEAAASLLHEVGIPADWRARLASALSAGQRQRLALARAIAARPQALILDESLSGLDLPSQGRILDLIQELRTAHSLAVVLISHDPRLLGTSAGEIVVMERGRIVEQAVTPTLLQRPTHSTTQLLLEAMEPWPPCF